MKLPAFVFLLFVTSCATIDKDRESIQVLDSSASGVAAAITGKTDSCTLLISKGLNPNINEFYYDSETKTCRITATLLDEAE